MNYKEARNYVEEFAKKGIVLGLESIKNLLDELDNPQEKLQFIHIAGTNGKGSVLAFISTIMETAGYITGRYISPTVLTYRERIQVNRQNIPKEDYAIHVVKVKDAIMRLIAQEKPIPSVFEIETAIAFLHFLSTDCDIVVMETGMGGISDATNIVKNTLACVITSVSRDHMEFLGESLEELTLAKVGIIKAGASVIYGNLPQVSVGIIDQRCCDLGCTIFRVDFESVVTNADSELCAQCFDYGDLSNLKIRLLGGHQCHNAALAISAVRSLGGSGFCVSDDDIRCGLAMTEWYGRLTVVREENPVIIVDGAHNIEAATALRATLKDKFSHKVVAGVMGVFKDKEVNEILLALKDIFSQLHTITLPNEMRSLSGEVLAQMAENIKISATYHDNLSEAIKAASVASDVVVVFGSLSHLKDVLHCELVNK